MTLAEVISKNLRKIRHEVGMSQRQLADATGLDEKFISQLENKPRHISTRTLERLAVGMGVDSTLLLGNINDDLGRTVDPSCLVGIEESLRVLKLLRERALR